jgi:uncharacterized protein (TIGR03067 family)
MVRFVTTVVLAASAVAVASAADDKQKEAMKALEGEYQLKQIFGNGKQEPDEVVKLVKGVVIAGGKLTVQLPGKDDATTFTVDPSKKPAHIDLDAPGMAGVVRPGIYKMEKGTLTIVWSTTKDRPADFDGKAKGSVKMVLEKRPEKK